MQKISPFLWFNDQAEEAANFYIAIFQNAKILGVTRYGEAGAKAARRPKGSVMTVKFQLEGQEFMALNGGPVFPMTPAISLVVNCQTQVEVDMLWKKLSAGGEPGQCAWLTDRYGVSWQIVPTTLIDMINDPDAEKAERVMQAMLQMKKINIKALQKAYASK
jgi:predicted 3-demethylubiquinone-9 3-methyltransferase (glyoxalase superfamily)